MDQSYARGRGENKPINMPTQTCSLLKIKVQLNTFDDQQWLPMETQRACFVPNGDTKSLKTIGCNKKLKIIHEFKSSNSRVIDREKKVFFLNH